MSQIRVSQIRARQIRARQIRARQIRASEISSNHRELHGAIFSFYSRQCDVCEEAKSVNFQWFARGATDALWRGSALPGAADPSKKVPLQGKQTNQPPPPPKKRTKSVAPQAKTHVFEVMGGPPLGESWFLHFVLGKLPAFGSASHKCWDNRSASGKGNFPKVLLSRQKSLWREGDFSSVLPVLRVLGF